MPATALPSLAARPAATAHWAFKIPEDELVKGTS